MPSDQPPKQQPLANVIGALEARSKRLAKLEAAMLRAATVTKGFHIIAVVTNPPSGDQAFDITNAVANLVEIARGETS